MFRNIWLVLLLSGLCNSLLAQKITKDRAEVSKVIKNFFEAFHKGDTAMMKTFFHPLASLTSISGKDGKIHSMTIAQFIHAIGQPHKEIWDERIFDEVVQSDGVVASVWVKYAFYLDNKFSHCGVDVFDLGKSDKGWLILHLADSRTTKDCEEHKKKTKK